MCSIMARIQDRQRATELRILGRTYSQIKTELGISKSTLSDWLSNYPLSDEQLLSLKKSRGKNREAAIEKTRNTKHRKRETRLKTVYENESRHFIPLNKKELEIAGLFLYLGEGNKRINGPVSLNNTDPQVLKFTLFWLQFGLGVSKQRIKVLLHLYNDMNIEKELEFWSKELGLPTSQFYKSYIKQSNRIDITQKGFGHGTCCLFVNDVRLKEKVMMGIKAIADRYSTKIEAMV